jgi:Domain of unknown function DUF11
VLFASINPSGSYDASFGDGGVTLITGMDVTSPTGDAIASADGTLFVAATVTLANGFTQPALTAVNATTGAPDTNLGSGGFRLLPAGIEASSTAIAAPASADGRFLILLGGVKTTKSQVVQGIDQGLVEARDLPRASACAFQSAPAVTPPLQRPCADLRVDSVRTGVFDDRSTENGYRSLLASLRSEIGYVYSGAAGFRSVSNWSVGETPEFAVTLQNRGQDAARFKLTTVPAGLRLLGEVNRVHGKDALKGLNSAPTMLGNGGKVTLLYATRLTNSRRKASTFTVSHVTPTDPLPGNNSRSTSISPGARQQWTVSLRHRALSVTQRPAAKAGARAAVTRSDPPVVAVLRARGPACRWLDRRGNLTSAKRQVPCRPVWLTLKPAGAGRWIRRLTRHRPRDAYLVLVRHTSQTTTELSTRLGNVRRVRF